MSDRRNNRRPRQPRSNPNFEANWDTRIENFDDMGLENNLLHGVYNYGFKRPSEIQSLAIKPIIDGRDVIAQAQSGTGKTGAFSIGVLNCINVQENTTQALLLSPTRELATQTYNFMKEVSQKVPNMTICLFKGGGSVEEDKAQAARRPHVIVATPGRAHDLIESSQLRCENIKICVLDEADEMLSEGFLEQVQNIFQYLQETVQLLLFSATVPPQVFNITEQFMKDPVKILVKAEKLTLEGIKQYYVNAEKDENKAEVLFDIYSKISINKAVIFVNSRDAVDFLKEQFIKKNYPADAIHSGLSQIDRDNVMRNFRLGVNRVLISTDLLARGIDVQQITLVINFELPNKMENYLHRIGRSGRYGRKGVAINILSNKEQRDLQNLERYYHTNIAPLPDDIDTIVKNANDSA